MRLRWSISPTSSTSTTAAGWTSPSPAWPRRTARATSRSPSSVPRLAGAGGFINSSQNARKVVFVGTFTAGGLALSFNDCRLTIEREGKGRKFVEAVEHSTFSGSYAASLGREVLCITERCVFRLTPEGPELTEIAPGVDPDRNILAQMAFAPLVGDPKPMDARLFRPEPMAIRGELVDLPLAARFVYDPAQDTVFINFARLEIKDQAAIAAIRD